LYGVGHYAGEMRVCLTSFAVILCACDGGGAAPIGDPVDAAAADAVPPDAEPPPDYRIATGQATPIAIVADETAVYWLNQGFRDELDNVQAGAILKRPHAGGDPEIIATGIERGWGLAIDEERVYWTAPGDHTIRSVRKDGTDAQTIATGYDAYAIAVGSARVVWREETAVVSAAKDGADVQVLDDAAVAIAPTLAADATHAYWTTTDLSANADVVRAPLDGSGTMEGVTNAYIAERVAITPTHLFHAGTTMPQEGYRVVVTRVDLATGVAVNVAREPGANPEIAIAGDTTYVAVDDFYDPTPPAIGALIRADFDPGPRTALVADQPHISGVAVTSDYVYWATTDASDLAHGGAISRLPR
jgi:hypothetical protein